MPGASWSLQRAIYAALQADASVLALLGGPRVFDDVPQRSELPYVTLGQTVVRDWSTGTEPGAEHLLTLHVWSRADGSREVQELMAAIAAALHERPLVLEGHVLVALRHELSEARLERDGEIRHGLVRLRALTEPA